jgi:hypothetical protein
MEYSRGYRHELDVSNATNLRDVLSGFQFGVFHLECILLFNRELVLGWPLTAVLRRRLFLPFNDNDDDATAAEYTTEDDTIEDDVDEDEDSDENN